MKNIGPPLATKPGRIRPVLWFSAVAALLAATACQTIQEPVGMPAANGTNSLPLMEGDVIRVTFETVTNLNSTQAIMLDGTISLPMIGQTKAAGLTIEEFAGVVKSLYESQLKTTDLVVSRVTSAASYSVGGAVMKPGKLPLDRPVTVLEAIMEAGGVNHARARISKVVVFRIEDGRRKRYQINLKDLLRGKEGELFYIKPFDVIFVPEKLFTF